jgi:membrane-bound hydrogenase subunit beta
MEGNAVEKTKLTLFKLAEAFPVLENKGTVPVARRIFLEVPSEIFMDVIKYACEELQFDHLCTITGLDAVEYFEFIYHISNDDGTVLNLKIKSPKENPVINSVLPVFNGATFYELELEGLLGVEVAGLPKDRQYPLPDNWPKGEYPLRKDWVPPEKPHKNLREEV